MFKSVIMMQYVVMKAVTSTLTLWEVVTWNQRYPTLEWSGHLICPRSGYGSDTSPPATDTWTLVICHIDTRVRSGNFQNVLDQFKDSLWRVKLTL